MATFNQNQDLGLTLDLSDTFIFVVGFEIRVAFLVKGHFFKIKGFL